MWGWIFNVKGGGGIILPDKHRAKREEKVTEKVSFHVFKLCLRVLSISVCIGLTCRFEHVKILCFAGALVNGLKTKSVPTHSG